VPRSVDYKAEQRHDRNDSPRPWGQLGWSGLSAKMARSLKVREGDEVNAGAFQDLAQKAGCRA
jgi:hypothetical protein